MRRPASADFHRLVMMDESVPGTAYRIVSMLAACATVLLGAIILYDGFTGNQSARYRGVTLGVAAVFLLVGWGLLVLERNLHRLRHCGMSSPDPESDRIAWRRVHGVLTLASAGFLVLASGGILGVVARLRSGSNIFG